MRTFANTRRRTYGETDMGRTPVITPTTDPRSDIALAAAAPPNPEEQALEQHVAPTAATSREDEFVVDATPDPKPVISNMEPGSYKLKGGFRLLVSEESITIDRQSASGDRISSGTAQIGNAAAGVIVSFTTVGADDESSEAPAPTPEPEPVPLPVAEVPNAV